MAEVPDNLSADEVEPSGEPTALDEHAPVTELEDTVADDAMPDDTVPEDAVPEDAVPEDAVPVLGASVLHDVAPVSEPAPVPELEDTVPEDTVPEDALLEDTVPDDAVPDDAVPDDAVPDDAVPEPAAPTPPPAPVSEASPAVGSTPKIGATAAADSPIPEPVRPDSEAGKIVGGSITSISSEEVALTLDDGRPAVINRRNFDDDGTDPSTVYQVGDRAEGAILTREDPKKRVVLSRAWALKKRAWEKVGEAAENGGVLTGTVTATSKRGVVVDAGVRGFVPSSHLELNPTADLSSYVGQTLEFRVLEVDPAKERLVLSRRSLLLKEQRKQAHDLLTGLEPGQVRTGTVSSLADYGAFIDLGGVNGLVHLSELSWRRVGTPSEVVSVGDEVEVKVLDVKVKKRRVALSIRQLTDDPLSAIVEGSIVEGPVSRLVDFGAFVDLGGVEGLVHLSELAEYRVSTPEEIVFPGEVVRARVLSVDKKRRRIELSIRQAVSGDFG